MPVRGIPFADQMDAYAGLREMFSQAPQVFAAECAELICLTFVMAYLSRLLPAGQGGSGLTGAVIGRMILILAGVIVNSLFMQAIAGTPLFRLAIIALQCFLSGAALLVTPAMIIGRILHLDPKNGFVAFLVKKLPGTGVGKALTTAVTNALIFVFAIMALERQYGSINQLVRQVPTLIAAFAPAVLMLCGIGIMIKAVTR